MSWARNNILGVAAIFIALSGTAIGASGSDQPGAEKTKSKKVKRGPPGPRGPAGAAGNAGVQGVQGVPGPSTGPAGGVLTGSYPNPGLASGSVGRDELKGANGVAVMFPPDLVAGACSVVTAAAPGAAAGDTTIVALETPPIDPLEITPLDPTSGNVRVRVCNRSDSDLEGVPPLAVRYLLIR